MDFFCEYLNTLQSVFEGTLRSLPVLKLHKKKMNKNKEKHLQKNKFLTKALKYRMLRLTKAD